MNCMNSQLRLKKIKFCKQDMSAKFVENIHRNEEFGQSSTFYT